MAEKYFPFTSQDNDRLYGSVDFRSFFRTILGNGRCTYDEYGVTDPRQSMLCSIDSIDRTKIAVTYGACYLFGAVYQTSDPLSITVELPTGATQNLGCVVARISEDVDRKISIITVEPRNAVNSDTDLILANYTSSSSGLVSVENVLTVAYAKYNLNKEQQDYIIEQLGKNTDLVNYLASNSQLITLLAANSQLLNLLSNSTALVNALAANSALHTGLANNPDFIEMIKGTQAEAYTYVVQNVDDLLRITHGDGTGYDFSNILIKAGTYNISSSQVTSGSTTLINTTLSGVKRITGEQGAVINFTNTTANRFYIFRGTAAVDNNSAVIRNIYVRTTVTATGGNCAHFDGMNGVYNCSGQFLGSNSTTNSYFVGNSNNIYNSIVDITNGVLCVPFVNCTNIGNVFITTNRVAAFFNSCYNVSGVKITGTDAISNTSRLIFDASNNITNVIVNLSLTDAGSITLCNNSNNITNMTSTITAVSAISGYINCGRLTNITMNHNSTNSTAQVLSGCTYVSTAAITSIGATTNGILNCQRMSNIHFQMQSSSTNAISGYNGCSLISDCTVTISGTGTQRYGYNSCDRIFGCGFSSNTNASSVRAFNNCTSVENFYADILNAVSVVGFNQCYEVSNGRISITPSGVGPWTGAYLSERLNNVRIMSSSNITLPGVLVGYQECSQLTGCMVTLKTETVSSGANVMQARGYINCSRLSSCRSDITGKSYMQGFRNCGGVSACESKILDTRTSTGGVANPIIAAYYDCRRLDGCLAEVGSDASAGNNGLVGFGTCLWVSKSTVHYSGNYTPPTSNGSYPIGFDECTALSYCGDYGQPDKIPTMYYNCYAGTNNQNPFPTTGANIYNYGWNDGTVYRD